jgi:DNA mismatch repair protein MutL
MEATRVTLDAGKFETVEACGAPPGTSMQVCDLFHNTPARLKFLKRPATEASHITHCFTALTLAALDVHMTLLLNGRLHTQALPTAALGDRLDMVFRAGMQDNLLEVEGEGDGIRVYGCIAKATFHRATRRQQFFFVNGRPVQNRTLSHALYETYRTLLPRERHPVAFLFLTVPSDEVDVNVHPAKLEVRFRQEARLHDRLRRLLRHRLQESLEGFPAIPGGVVPPVFESRQASQPVPMMWQTPIADAPAQLPTADRTTGQPVTAVSQELGLHAGYPAAGRAILDGRPLGQLHDTYILMQYPDGIFIVDQHAAHERVVYEGLWARFQNDLGESQQLLFPVTLNLPGTDPQWVASCLPRLTALGFSLEPFGGDAYRVYSVPALLAERDYAAALMDVFDVLRTPGVDEPADVSLQDLPQVLDQLLTVMACHGAVRAHQRLQEAEIHALMRDLSHTARPFTCPHGRPVLLNVALSEIEKKFLRR